MDAAQERSFDILGDLASLTTDPKPTEDCSAAVATAIAEADAALQEGKAVEAVIEPMLVLEKRCRLASDAASSSILCCKILKIFRQQERWTNVIEYIVLLSKKRAQLKRVITDMVRLCMVWIDIIESKETMRSLADTLSSVTEGKIFVEVDRARLIRKIAHMKEAEGKIEEAVKLLHDVQVETFGTMERREKLEYIIDQMRLLLLSKDFVRLRIISKKINPKMLEAEEFQDLKLQYHQYIIKDFIHENEILSVCKSFFSIFKTPIVQEVHKDWQLALQNYIFFLLLAPFDNEQSDLLAKVRVTEFKRLEEIPVFKRLVNDFLTDELISIPVPYVNDFEGQWIREDPLHQGVWEQRLELLRKRIIQHNIRVMGKHYSRVNMNRVCELLRVSSEVAENEISELVTSGFLEAKMDRPAGILRFGRPRTAVDHLNQWARSVGNIMDKLEDTSQLIQREKMINEALAKREELFKKHQEV